MQLIEDAHVIFVGYKQPHPLLHHILLRIQTDGKYSPESALQVAITALTKELDGIEADLRRTEPAVYDLPPSTPPQQENNLY